MRLFSQLVLCLRWRRCLLLPLCTLSHFHVLVLFVVVIFCCSEAVDIRSSFQNDIAFALNILFAWVYHVAILVPTLDELSMSTLTRCLLLATLVFMQLIKLNEHPGRRWRSSNSSGQLLYMPTALQRGLLLLNHINCMLLSC